MDNQLSIEIDVRGLRKSFPQMLAVNDLSFTVPAGQVFGLVGPDGAGKTITIRMLAGILPPDAGEIPVAGCDVVADPESVEPLISYMPQRFGLYEDLTVDENIRFYTDLFGVGRRQRERRAEELLRACALNEFRCTGRCARCSWRKEQEASPCIAPLPVRERPPRFLGAAEESPHSARLACD